MGDLMPVDVSILIACNYTADVDCGKQLTSLGKERGSKSLRFWQGTKYAEPL